MYIVVVIVISPKILLMKKLLVPVCSLCLHRKDGDCWVLIIAIYLRTVTYIC